MNTIVCLSVVLVVIAAFFATPWLMARRFMKSASPALTRKEMVIFEIGLAVCFGLMIAVCSNLVADLAEGYAALLVQEVGWWTL